MFVYQNTDHPMTSNTSGGTPNPWDMVYRFKNNGDFILNKRGGGAASLTLHREGRLSTSPIENHFRLADGAALNSTGFAILKPEPMFGIFSKTIVGHGLTDLVAEQFATWRAVEQNPVTGQSDHEILRAGWGVIRVRRQFGQSLGDQFRLNWRIDRAVKRFALKINGLNPNSSADNLRQGLLGLGRPLFWIVGSAHRLTASTRRRRWTTRTGNARNDLVHSAHPAGHLPAQAQVDFLEPCLILVAIESDEEDRGRGGKQAEVPSQNPPADGVKNHGCPGAFAAASMT
jgi:hypothetical protein